MRCKCDFTGTLTAQLQTAIPWGNVSVTEKDLRVLLIRSQNSLLSQRHWEGR